MGPTSDYSNRFADVEERPQRHATDTEKAAASAPSDGLNVAIDVRRAAGDGTASALLAGKAFDRTYAEDALRDLAAADKALDNADAELMLARTGR